MSQNGVVAAQHGVDGTAVDRDRIRFELDDPPAAGATVTVEVVLS